VNYVNYSSFCGPDPDFDVTMSTVKDGYPVAESLRRQVDGIPAQFDTDSNPTYTITFNKDCIYRMSYLAGEFQVRQVGTWPWPRQALWTLYNRSGKFVRSWVSSRFLFSAAGWSSGYIDR
jgi:hypothetical protein